MNKISLNKEINANEKKVKLKNTVKINTATLEGVVFEFDDTKKDELNARMVIALFQILYDQKKITEKEYDSLVLKVCRTFNLNK